MNYNNCIFIKDFTLWPYWVDTTAVPPFKKELVFNFNFVDLCAQLIL